MKSGDNSSSDNMQTCLKLRSYLDSRLSNDSPEFGTSYDAKLTALKPIHQKLCQLLDDQKDLESMVAEPGELGEMARADLLSNRQDLDDELVNASNWLLPENRFDHRNASLEVVPGAGGMEASLFAQEIFTLYTGYASSHGLEVEVTEYVETDLNGIYKAVATVSGHGAFDLLKYECGVHRVQRVPVTATGKKAGLLQTSTCSVAVLPEPNETDLSPAAKDLKVEFMRSSGAGGQGVNTANSACRIAHLPSGVVVKAQDTRSPSENQKIALNRLTKILFHTEFEKQLGQTLKFRKSQIGNMNRNEKIRTYNFVRHQVSDHRIHVSKAFPDLSDFLKGQFGFGHLDEMREKLKETHQAQSLRDFLDSEK